MRSVYSVSNKGLACLSLWGSHGFYDGPSGTREYGSSSLVNIPQLYSSSLLLTVAPFVKNPFLIIGNEAQGMEQHW